MLTVAEARDHAHIQSNANLSWSFGCCRSCHSAYLCYKNDEIYSNDLTAARLLVCLVPQAAEGANFEAAAVVTAVERPQLHVLALPEVQSQTERE